MFLSQLGQGKFRSGNKFREGTMADAIGRQGGRTGGCMRAERRADGALLIGHEDGGKGEGMKGKRFAHEQKEISSFCLPFPL